MIRLLSGALLFAARAVAGLAQTQGEITGIVQWDASLLKSFRFLEDKRLQFRFEAFNAANHPNFGIPDTSVTSTNFGRITSTRLNMRELQFGLKLMF